MEELDGGYIVCWLFVDWLVRDVVVIGNVFRLRGRWDLGGFGEYFEILVFYLSGFRSKVVESSGRLESC